MWLKVVTFMVSITFMVNFYYVYVGITFMVFITFMGDTEASFFVLCKLVEYHLNIGFFFLEDVQYC